MSAKGTARRHVRSAPDKRRREPRRRTAALRPHAHPLVVPGMSDETYGVLRDDIAARGVETPLEITADGIVLDGCHRLRAAREVGVAEVPIRIVAPDDEVEHILRSLLRRRHLNAGQLAAVAIELEEYQLASARAKKRQLANLRRSPEVATLPPRGERTRDLAARAAGVSPRTVQDVATVRAADPALYQQVKEGKLPANIAAQRVRQARRYAEIGPAPALPTERFEVTYADPAWQLGNPQAAYAPENYYPTMPLEEIKALEVPVADDACLFLWAVNSLLPEALEVMAAWGFKYKTNYSWVKPAIGMGVWARNRHELLLFGVRGNWSPPHPKDRCDSVIEARRGRHSEKPVDAYERIERMYPHASKLELFARGKPRPGWTAWGNEVEQ